MECLDAAAAAAAAQSGHTQRGDANNIGKVGQIGLFGFRENVTMKKVQRTVRVKGVGLHSQ